jgi:hypothetical protein
MDDHDPSEALSEAPSEPLSEVDLEAKRAFLMGLDRKLAADGYPVDAPPASVAPAPPAPVPAAPPLLLSFEAWAELRIRLDAASPDEDIVAMLYAVGLTRRTWQRLDDVHRLALSDDVRAGRRELSAIFEAKQQEALARGARAPTPPIGSAAGTPSASPSFQLAPQALRATAGLADVPAATLETMGRMPFVPPAPEAPADGKRPAKTEQSRVVPTRIPAGTMGLDAAQPRLTPALPFTGSAGSPGVQGVSYVPTLHARQYVSLCAALAVGPAPREETLGGYDVPNEAAFRALQEEWQHPDRRAELELAMREFGVMLWGMVLR